MGASSAISLSNGNYKAHVLVAPDKDIVTEIRALPKRRAKDAAKDALIAQTLYEDEDNKHLLLLHSNKWGRVKEICTFYCFKSDSKF